MHRVTTFSRASAAREAVDRDLDRAVQAILDGVASVLVYRRRVGRSLAAVYRSQAFAPPQTRRRRDGWRRVNSRLQYACLAACAGPAKPLVILAMNFFARRSCACWPRDDLSHNLTRAGSGSSPIKFKTETRPFLEFHLLPGASAFKPSLTQAHNRIGNRGRPMRYGADRLPKEWCYQQIFQTPFQT